MRAAHACVCISFVALGNGFTPPQNPTGLVACYGERKDRRPSALWDVCSFLSWGGNEKGDARETAEHAPLVVPPSSGITNYPRHGVGGFAINDDDELNINPPTPCQ